MTKLRFAIVGCGRIFKKHFEAIRDIENAEIVAVADINTKKAKAAGEIANVPHYLDYNEMLSKENIDVVSILTPSGMHPKHTIDIANEAGKPVAVYWPDDFLLSVGLSRGKN